MVDISGYPPDQQQMKINEFFEDFVVKGVNTLDRVNALLKALGKDVQDDFDKAKKTLLYLSRTKFRFDVTSSQLANRDTPLSRAVYLFLTDAMQCWNPFTETFDLDQQKMRIDKFFEDFAVKGVNSLDRVNALLKALGRDVQDDFDEAKKTLFYCTNTKFRFDVTSSQLANWDTALESTIYLYITDAMQCWNPETETFNLKSHKKRPEWARGLKWQKASIEDVPANGEEATSSSKKAKPSVDAETQKRIDSTSTSSKSDDETSDSQVQVTSNGSDNESTSNSSENDASCFMFLFDFEKRGYQQTAWQRKTLEQQKENEEFRVEKNREYLENWKNGIDSFAPNVENPPEGCCWRCSAPMWGYGPSPWCECSDVDLANRPEPRRENTEYYPRQYLFAGEKFGQRIETTKEMEEFRESENQKNLVVWLAAERFQGVEDERLEES